MEIGKSRKIHQLNKGLFYAAMLVSVMAIVKTVLFSTDIDESYALSVAYRLLSGDKLLYNMWEPHQLSAYCIAGFMGIYEWIVGDYTGVVIYLRTIGVLIHLGLGIWLYRKSSVLVSPSCGVILFLLHINFLPKWLQLPEFELLNYWMLLLAFLFLTIYVEKEASVIAPACVGLILVLQIMNYPTMILLYPVYVWGIGRMSKKARRDIYIVTLCALISGIAFLFYLFSYMDVRELQVALQYIFADPSHTSVSFGYRILSYGKELGIDMLLAAGIMCICYLLFYTKTGKHRLLCALKGTVVLYTMAMVFGCLFADQNQFFLQERYGICAIIGVVCYGASVKERREKVCFYMGIVPGMVAMVATLLITNMTVGVAYSKLFVSVMATFMLLLSEKQPTCSYKMTYTMAYGLLAGLLLCKLMLIRVTGCLPVTMNAEFERIANGPFKGIYALQKQGETRNFEMSVLKEYVDPGDKLLYFGCDSSVYIDLQAEVSAASVQGTAVFNEDFIDYFAIFPEKYPDVIVVDEDYSEEYYYVYSPYNYILAEWIETEYTYRQVVKQGELCIYLR